MTTDYQKMTIKEKERANRQHGLPNRCPECDMAVPPEDVPGHIDRCPGRAPPHPRARWVAFKQALKMGVPKKDLLELVGAGIIRTKGEKGSRRYLLRDVAKSVQAKAAKEKIVKAKADAKADAKAKANTLTGKAKGGANKGVKTKALKIRLSEYVESVGSFAAAARKLDIPIDAIKNAAKGKKILEGTKMRIEFSLDRVGA